MSIGTPVHRGSNGGTGPTLAIVSFTPAAGSLILAPWGRRWNMGAPAASTITDSTARTWTPISFSPNAADDGSSLYVRIGLSWAIATGAPMIVTASQAAGAKTGFHVTEIPGAFAGITNFDADDDTAGDPTAVMATPGGASISYAFAMFCGTSSVSPPTGFTELHERISSTDLVTQSSWKAAAADTAAWATANNFMSLGAIMEIRPAGRTRAVGLWFS